MEWLEDLRGKTVGLDAAPLIYFIEENPTYLDNVHAFFQALDDGELHAVTSVVTLIEALVHPLRRGEDALAQQYRDILLSAEGLDIVPISAEVAEGAARLRAAHDLRTPDAIQMSAAVSAGASHFLTNDLRLPSLPNLRILALDELRERT